MKFSINQTHIHEVLTKFGRVLSNKVSVPILSGVLVQVTGKYILFTASDATDSIIVRLLVDESDEVFVEEEGTTVLPKDLFDVTKRLKGKIDFELLPESSQIKISQNKTVINFSVMDPDEYPKIANDSTNTARFQFSGNEFSEIIRKTSFAASKSETRPILQAVLMNFSQSGNYFVSTDSHRLAAVSKDTLDKENCSSVAVPAKALDQALKAFDLSKDVFIMVSDQQIALANGNTVMYSRLLEGNYPQTDRLIPREFSYQISFNRTELIDALELLQSLTNNNSVQMKIGNLFASFEARGDISKGNREIAYDNFEGEEGFTIAFNAQFVLDALKTFDSSSIRISFAGIQKPFIITEVTDTSSSLSSLQLVLPIRIY